MSCKLQDGDFVSNHMLKMKGCFDRIEQLGLPFPQELSIDMGIRNVDAQRTWRISRRISPKALSPQGLMQTRKLRHGELDLITGNKNKKHIAKLHSGGILESFNLELDDVCESCLLEKMTKAPFTCYCERGKDLLHLIQENVCELFRSTTLHGDKYFVTFTNDFSRYGMPIILENKYETFHDIPTRSIKLSGQ
uniref:GAG-pre-integrase domain-containing protein n=1 Tax=Lactuca sativa TaxID=4236 RepID=A0A9R1UWV7_LACSA|nr:hypothetical protein LSAT_V11C800414000 [Lactuca sativa]